MARPLSPLQTKILTEASTRPLRPAGDTLKADGSKVSHRTMATLRAKGWLKLNWKGFETSRIGLLALGGYSPTLGEAGFMDLLQTMLERSEQLEGEPRLSITAAVALQDLQAAAKRYVAAVEGTTKGH